MTFSDADFLGALRVKIYSGCPCSYEEIDNIFLISIALTKIRYHNLWLAIDKIYKIINHVFAIIDG